MSKRDEDTPKTAWDRRVERIQHSLDPVERRHLYLGKSREFGYPVLLDRELLHQHAWIHGGTGSRKTSLGVSTLSAQLIAGESKARREWLGQMGVGREQEPDERCSVLVLDLKGDPSLLWSCYLEAEQAGVPFKLFTNVVGRQSHVFNPLDPAHLAALTTTNQRCQTILQALSAEYGSGYGRSFYSAMNEIVLLLYLKKYGTGGSFERLYAMLSDRDLFPGQASDWAKAQHLPAIAGRLAGVHPLTLTPGMSGDDPAVFDGAIRMPDLLRESQVVYFYLQTSIERTTVAAVAQLALYTLFCAAAMRPADAKHRVYCFVDEFQEVISQNLAALFEQARSMGLSLIMSHQHTAQLRLDRGSDLAEGIESAVGFEQMFRISGTREMKRVLDLSGQKQDYSRSWRQSALDSLSHWNATSELEVSEIRSPRLTPNDIIKISAAPFDSISKFSHGSGYTQYSGFFVPLVSEFHITPEQYDARLNAGWPALGPSAVTVQGDEPTEGSQTDHEKRLNEFLTANGHHTA